MGRELREDRIRRLGLRVVRWTWDEAFSPAAFAAVLRSSGIHRAR
ncbi:hypothetical protein [Cellulosimicrobium marinum]|nr:hypothetical protein [Cellulosimicrobium marinum]